MVCCVVCCCGINAVTSSCPTRALSAVSDSTEHCTRTLVCVCVHTAVISATVEMPQLPGPQADVSTEH
ncbi:hypothetical protein PHYPO_G00038680 [Pangasianodon hypophthalmus]|uniref:Uncharacterized protein n=1 Tax=Pangasianodon hypophthalmus TaxID=310915 RepID=A0A5N5MLD2_PANHP|nr:hypothetical protein PHYPO_G00038680 [Pangasianodon hypophthalmus]